jgi:SAM-dependent methyltransferase
MSTVRSPLRALRSLPRNMRRLLGIADRASADDAAPFVAFRCNVCGAGCRAAPEAISRETISCQRCGSTVRFRAIAHLLTTELFGRSIALPDLHRRKDISGIGLSDFGPYARQLADKLDYTNTHYHAEPRLDITDLPADSGAAYDFIIASDVFEHVAPPVSRAFVNARRMLKGGGVMIFTVPFTLEAETIEHFPDLHDYRLLETPRGRRLENRTADGRLQVYDELVFHGGPGSTLEMRVFSRASLEREFAQAGFSRMRIAGEPCPEFGIAWPEPWSVPMVAYA